MAKLEMVDGFIEDGDLHDVTLALRETERAVEATFGEYLKLCARRDALRARGEELAERIATAPQRLRDLSERLHRPTRQTLSCRGCGRAVRSDDREASISGGLAYCKRCVGEVEIFRAMEDAENG